MQARVYRNLNNGRWSIQQRINNKWTVIGHAEYVELQDVSVKQSAAGRDRARKQQQRNVHCMAEGTLAYADGFTSFKDRPIAQSPAHRLSDICERYTVTYNPFIHETLVYADSGKDFEHANYAVFTATQKMEVSN